MPAGPTRTTWSGTGPVSVKVLQEAFKVDEPGDDGVWFSGMRILDEFMREDAAHPELPGPEDILPQTVPYEKRVGGLGRDFAKGCLVDGGVRLADPNLRRKNQRIEVRQQSETFEHSYEQFGARCRVGDDSETVAAATEAIEELCPAGDFMNAPDIGAAMRVGNGHRERRRRGDARFREHAADDGRDVDFVAACRAVRFSCILGDARSNFGRDGVAARTEMRVEFDFQIGSNIRRKRFEPDHGIAEVKEDSADTHPLSVRRRS